MTSPSLYPLIPPALLRGVQFSKFHESSSSSDSRTFFLSSSVDTLYWCKNPKKLTQEPDKSLPIRSLTALYKGKSDEITEVWTKGKAKKSPESRCFTLVFHDKILCLEAANEEERNSFLNAIIRVFYLNCSADERRRGSARPPATNWRVDEEWEKAKKDVKQLEEGKMNFIPNVVIPPSPAAAERKEEKKESAVASTPVKASPAAVQAKSAATPAPAPEPAAASPAHVNTAGKQRGRTTEERFLMIFESRFPNCPEWLRGNYGDAVSQARASNKLVFCYLHDETAPNFDRFVLQTLSAPRVRQYLSTNFVCWTGNILHVDAFKLSHVLQVTEFPFFTLLQPVPGGNVKVLVRYQGFCSADEIVKMISEAIEKEKSAAANGNQEEKKMIGDAVPASPPSKKDNAADEKREIERERQEKIARDAQREKAEREERQRIQRMEQDRREWERQLHEEEERKRGQARPLPQKDSQAPSIDASVSFSPDFHQQLCDPKEVHADELYPQPPSSQPQQQRDSSVTIHYAKESPMLTAHHAPSRSNANANLLLGSADSLVLPNTSALYHPETPSTARAKQVEKPAETPKSAAAAYPVEPAFAAPLSPYAQLSIPTAASVPATPSHYQSHSLSPQFHSPSSHSYSQLQSPSNAASNSNPSLSSSSRKAAYSHQPTTDLLQARIVELSEEVQKLRADKSALQSQVINLESTSAARDITSKDLQQSNIELKSQNSGLQHRLQRSEEEFQLRESNLLARNRELASQLQQFQREMERMGDELQRSHESTSAGKGYRELLSQIDELRTETAAHERVIGELRAKNDQLTAEAAEYKGKWLGLQNSMAALELKNQHLTAENEHLNAKLRHTSNELENEKKNAINSNGAGSAGAAALAVELAQLKVVHNGLVERMKENESRLEVSRKRELSLESEIVKRDQRNGELEGLVEELRMDLEKIKVKLSLEEEKKRKKGENMKKQGKLMKEMQEMLKRIEEQSLDDE